MRTRYVPGLMSKLDLTVTPVRLRRGYGGGGRFLFSNFFSPGDEVPVFVKDSRRKGKVVVAPPRTFTKTDRVDINVRQDGKLRLGVTTLEKLSLQFDRNVSNFFLR